MTKKQNISTHRTARKSITKAEREKLECAISAIKTEEMANLEGIAKAVFADLVNHKQRHVPGEELRILRKHQAAVGMEYCSTSELRIRVAFDRNAVSRNDIDKCPILEDMTEFEHYGRHVPLESYKDGELWMVSFSPSFADTERHDLTLSPLMFGKDKAPVFRSIAEFAESREAAFFIACVDYHKLAKKTRSAFRTMLTNTNSIDKLKEWWPEALSILSREEILVEGEDELDTAEQLKEARALVSGAQILSTDTSTCSKSRR